ncbi:hypothetical protein V8F06_003745 [Rhypophila decipiens]
MHHQDITQNDETTRETRRDNDNDHNKDQRNNNNDNNDNNDNDDNDDEEQDMETDPEQHFKMTSHFRFVVKSLTAAAEMVALLGFTPCPDLFKAITATAPPSLVWWKSLPTAIPKDAWGIYTLVYELSGFKPMVLRCLGPAPQSPKWASKCPAVSNPPRQRAISSNRWDTPGSSSSPFGEGLTVGRLSHRSLKCPIGDLEVYTYGGLCSHSPLLEDVASRLDNSAQQLAEMDRVVREKNKAYQEVY